MKSEQCQKDEINTFLSKRQFELDNAFKEIRRLKDQTHQYMVIYANLNEEEVHWEHTCHHLEPLLEHIHIFTQSLLQGHKRALTQNLLNDTQKWRERHSNLAEFSTHVVEDLPEMLKKSYG